MMIKNIYIYFTEIILRGMIKRREVINYSKTEKLDTEKKELIKNIKKSLLLKVFPYDFTKKYKLNSIKVYNDKEADLPYVVHKNKRLYLRQKPFEFLVKNYYKTLLIESDSESPHKYLDSSFDIDNNTILFDLGAAEGIFALENVEKCKHIYLFECDDTWIRSLEKTFEPYKDKVTIVKKYVSNNNDENNITIDSYLEELKETDNVFVKMDIEGAEIKAIEGMNKVLDKIKNIKLAVCSYHNQSDEVNIRKLFDEKFEITPTKGYVLFYYDPNFKSPYFRRCVLRIKK